jgi:uncharacterized protein YpmS
VFDEIDGGMKWFKASVWLVSLVVLLAIGIGAVAWFMLRGTPDWYRQDTSTADQRKKNAAEVENKLVNLTNQFKQRNAAEYRINHQPRATTAEAMTAEQARVLRAQKPDEPVTIQFTDDQLNAFFDKWADFQNRRTIFEQYVDHPRIVMQKNQIILVGLIKDMGLVVSMQFEPRIDGDGNLRLDLVRVMGGMLPLPDSMWEKQRASLERMLGKKLPKYQRDAEISPDGYANGALASAAMNEMILAVLRGGSSSAAIFVPASIQRLSPTIPVKITSVSIQDNTMTLSAQQMTAEERKKLVEKIQAFEPTRF